MVGGGVVTRFVQDQLDIIFWLRPAQAPEFVFGCLIEADDLRDLWPEALPEQDGADGNHVRQPHRCEKRSRVVQWSWRSCVLV